MRWLDGGYFAGMVAACSTLETVVLHAFDTASFCFELIASALLEKGVRVVVMLPALTATATGSVVARLCSALLARTPADALQNELRAAHPDAHAAKVVNREFDSLLATSRPRAHAASVGAPPISMTPVPLSENRVQSELRRKREAESFDVFLCHNSNDRRAVIGVAKKLKAVGILPWLDIWELPPGKPWQPELERQIPKLRSAAVFVGATGVGPWQEAELEGFLDEFVNRKVPVIPVLLPDVIRVPALPFFLRRMVWVDFRATEPDPFERLLWGITGKRPEN
jgi:hypothetical protein